METVYVETTIVGNVAGRLLKDPTASLRQQATRDWWLLAKSHFELLISPVVLDECGGGDPAAAQERLDVVESLKILKTHRRLSHTCIQSNFGESRTYF